VQSCEVDPPEPARHIIASRGIGARRVVDGLVDRIPVRWHSPQIEDGRPEIVDQVAGADAELLAHLVARFAELLDDDKVLAALPGHLLDEGDSPGRLPLVPQRIAAIAEMG